MRSVAFLGPNGSYTHEAAMNYAKTRDASLVPQVTIKDVFDAVLSGSTTHGVVPVENSTNGSVTMTFDLFRDLKHGNLKVCGQEFVQVEHALLGKCRLEEIERIYSHPQVRNVLHFLANIKAFGQCELWLDKHLKGVERINVSSTSKAARLLKDDPKAAAISSRICADIYHTGVIAETIQDTKGIPFLAQADL
jgi:prephenate dehydratase